MRKVLFALSSWTCKYPDDIIQSAIEGKFEAVEWDLNYIPMPLSSLRREQLRTAFSDNGISVRFHLPYSTCDIGSADPRIRAISQDFIALNLDLIADMGSDYAVLHFGALPSQYRRNVSLESLEQTIAHAKSLGITIGIENLLSGITSEPIEMQTLVQDLDLNVVLDVGHARTIGKLDEYLRLLGPSVTHIHFYDREDESRNHLEFSTMSTAVNAAIRLMDSCPATWWTCEVDSLSSCVRMKAFVEGAYASFLNPQSMP